VTSLESAGSRFTALPVAAARRFIVNSRTALASLAQRPRLRRAHLSAWFPPGRLAGGALLTILAVAAAMMVADSWAIAQRLLVPPSFMPFFQFLSDAGRSDWVLIPTATMLIAIAFVASPALGRNAWGVLNALAVRIGFVFLAVGVPGLAVTIVKRLIGRARPNRVEGADIHFVPFSWDSNFASLPSGHSTTAFATAVALGALFPWARVPLFVIAAAIALSRIVVGAHYPSDIIAGAVFGALGALLVRAWFADRRLGFGVTQDGAVQAFAGPSLRRIGATARRLAGQP
jgi:membrane-associated phospholipid phosphatase